jgi:dolichol-phosphate mannosyltransferase
MKKKGLKASVILPTYNEAGNIVELVNQIRKYLKANRENNEVIIVDDNSPDNTGYLAKDRFEKQPEVKVVIRKKDRGLASAIRTGIEKAKGDVIVVMDTDFNHEPKVVPELISKCEECDLVIGSRFVSGGGMVNKKREFLSWAYNCFIVRPIISSPIKDNLSGFFAVRRDQLVKLNWDNIFYGYGDYFIRLIHRATKNSWRIAEIPFIHRERRAGSSKSNLYKVFFQYTKSVLKLGNL